MAMITKNEYGMVVVNNTVLRKMALDDILSMDDYILPCNKNGKLLKKGLLTGYNELLAAVEITEYNTDVFVRVFFVSRFGVSIKDISNELFDKIERDFELLCLDKPYELHASIKGILTENSAKISAKDVTKKDLEVTRHND